MESQQCVCKCCKTRMTIELDFKTQKFKIICDKNNQIKESGIIYEFDNEGYENQYSETNLGKFMIINEKEIIKESEFSNLDNKKVKTQDILQKIDIVKKYIKKYSSAVNILSSFKWLV